MALEGTLRDFSLADIFQLIGIQKKTGVLSLKYDGEVVTVSFLNGDVVSADSLNKNLEDRLGTVLVNSGRITEAQLRQALKLQRETLKRLGYILVDGRYITETDLKEALRLQITQIVFRLFRWKDGEYHFSQEESVEYDREHFTPLSAESILMEGIRMIDEWPIIERKIRSFEQVFRKMRPDVRPMVISRDEYDAAETLDTTISATAAVPMGAASHHEAIRLAREEAAVYALVDGHRTVQAIIDGARMGDFETCRILYDLLSRGLIVPEADAAVPARPEAHRRSAGPVLEGIGYLILLAAVAASLATIGRSPFSGSPRLLAPPGALEEINELVCHNRIERIDEAVQIYYLQKGFYPDDLKDLVRGRLLPELTLFDPWGRGFGFISLSEGYRIIAYDSGGVENPNRSVVRGHVPPAQPDRRAPGKAAARMARPAPSDPRTTPDR